MEFLFDQPKCFRGDATFEGRDFCLSKFDFAPGDFEADLFAGHAALAQLGQHLEQMKKALRILLQGFSKGGKIELSQQLTDFQRANLLSSQVDLAILIFAEKIKVQLNLSGGVLAPLAFLKPDEVTSVFPAGKVVFVQGFP